MRSLIFAAAALACLTQAASAQVVNDRCRQTYDGFSCTTVFGSGEYPGAKIISVPPPRTLEEWEDQQEREAEWVRVCKPFGVIGRDGLTRITYARACPNGYIVGNGRRPKEADE